MRKSSQVWIPILFVAFTTIAASAQSFRVQCPSSTVTHPPAPITAASQSGNMNTISTALVPAVGDTIIVAGVTPVGYNGTYTVTSVGSGSFSYSNPNPPVAIAGATSTATTVTITTSLVPNVGDIVTIAGLSPAGYNGTFSVTGVGTGTFSYANPLPPAPITAATETGTTVTIASSFVPAVGDMVVIAGVTPAGYNGGPFQVTAAGTGTFSYALTATGLAAGTGGTVAEVLSSGASATVMDPSVPVVMGPGTLFGTVTDNNSEPPYNGPTAFALNAQGYLMPTPGTVNGAIKCQQISGGDGLMTEADGTQTFMFSFGPLSGLADIAAGKPGTQFPATFNTPFSGTLTRGDPATSDNAKSGASPGFDVTGATAPVFTWNGAVGLAPEVLQTANISDMVQGNVPPPPTGTTPGTATGTCPNPPVGSTVVTAYTFEPVNIPVGGTVIISDAGPSPTNPQIPAGYKGTFTITCEASPVVAPSGFAEYAFQYDAAPAAGLAEQTLLQGVTVSTPPQFDGHVDPRQIMDVGVMNGNIPAPLLAFDEDDEVFYTLTNVGMIMRPDLFEQHTVHFHGYPNASSFYDGVPDASVAINIGASFTYYYLSPDAGTYFWHCHITPPEHLQMGMVGQLYVRPRQDRVPVGKSLYTALKLQNGQVSGQTVDLRTACNPAEDILCSAVTPPTDPGVSQATDLNVIDPATGVADLPYKYAYNDGDGSTKYDVEYPIQMHGFDPNFHFVGMTFNPEMFVDMKDKYFLLNGRSYPDTVGLCGGQVTGCIPGPQATITTDGQMHYSQPLPALINIPLGGRALLRLVNLSVSEYHTLASLGIRMKEIGFNAKLLRDQAGNNTEFYTNSITLGGGESLDVILDASDAGCGGISGCSSQLYPAGSVFYIYTPQLDHLSNDAENFGGMMTEVHICNQVIGTTFGNICK